jgi:hypothetical protein
MKLILILLLLVLSTLSWSSVEERNADFTLSTRLLSEGEIQYALEWLSPDELINKELRVIDSEKIHNIKPRNNHLIISKIAFIAKKPFDTLSYSKMNNAAFISKMLSSVSIQEKLDDLWRVTNKVKAYSIPFKVSFDLKLKEIHSNLLTNELTRYFRDEASAFKASSRERFIILDMTNFSQLMYRNYSVVFIKEISQNETLIVSGIVAGFDLNAANSYFNFPPFSSTKATMIGNLKTQILNMARSLQN